MINKKEYIGDGAYVSFDGYQIVLTAENGYCATDTICLEPEVLDRFLDYIKRLDDMIQTYNSQSITSAAE